MNLNNVRIGPRMGIGFGAVLALMLAIVFVAHARLRHTSEGVHEMATQQKCAAVAREWIGKTQLNVARTLAIAKSSGQRDVDMYFTPLIQRTSGEISALQKTLLGLVKSPDGMALMARAGERRAAYLASRDALFHLVSQADQPAAEALMKDQLLPASEAYIAAMTAVYQHELKLTEATELALDKGIVNGGNVLLALLGAGLAVGTWMAFFITRSVTLPLRQAVDAARVIAGSDLSQTVVTDRRDELGDLLRALGQMQGSLARLVAEVRGSTDSIGTASAEIATGTLDLSVRTEQTSSNLQQAASSMDQLTSTVMQAAESARHANQLAHSAAEVAARGGAVVAQVVTTMDDINASSKKIADIIGVIDSIAFQTNILALNAAVEAARAGEQGRGFAVVASEVRSLAQRSAGAAKEIKRLIGASVEKVQGGSELVAAAGRTMTEIVGSVQRVSDIIGEITSASAEQSDGIGEVNGSVIELDRMTQQNAALVEQSSATAESLKEQAARLADVVGRFKL